MIFYKVIEFDQKTFEKPEETARILQDLLNRQASKDWIFVDSVSKNLVGKLLPSVAFFLTFKKEFQLPEGLQILADGVQISVSKHNFAELVGKGWINPETKALKQGEAYWSKLVDIAPELLEAAELPDSFNN